MLTINIEKRGELYKDYQNFKLTINGESMIDGDYKAQDVQDFMSTICVVSEAFTGHSGLCTACNMSPKRKDSFVQIQDARERDREQRERDEFRREADRRNRERNRGMADMRERSINEEHGKGRKTNAELQAELLERKSLTSPRNAILEAKSADVKVTDTPTPLLEDRKIWTGAARKAHTMRPTKNMWAKAVEFFTGKDT